MVHSLGGTGPGRPEHARHTGGGEGEALERLDLQARPLADTIRHPSAATSITAAAVSEAAAWHRRRSARAWVTDRAAARTHAGRLSLPSQCARRVATQREEERELTAEERVKVDDEERTRRRLAEEEALFATLEPPPPP